jgi:hypothetical protein
MCLNLNVHGHCCIPQSHIWYFDLKDLQIPPQQQSMDIAALYVEIGLYYHLTDLPIPQQFLDTITAPWLYFNSSTYPEAIFV